ncbi:MAG: NAD(P)-dependent glycerol-1-phosphate dehydrogenase [Candidatus Bathyarchaeia archaeon]
MVGSHRIDLPRVVLIGEDVLDSLEDILKELGFHSALLVTGYKTFEVAGRRALENLRAAQIEVREIFVANSTPEYISRVEDEIKRCRYEVVVGVGGGRVIDIAKMSSARARRPFISVPTTASHDGIASSVASLKGLDRPYSVKAQSPIAVIADSKIIRDSPYRYTASGCGDVVSKSVSVRDWRLAHEVEREYYGAYAASLALMSANHVIERAEEIRGRTEEGIRTLLEALVSCGVAMSIAGSSRPCSGSEHLFSHALDMIAPKPALHGEQCGVGTIMMARLHGLDWEEVRDTLRLLDGPTTAGELGIGEDYIVEALVRAKEIRPERYTILNEANLTSSKARSLAEFCGVI